MSDKEKLDAILEIIRSYGGNDGSHHKMWLDQVVQIATGDKYEETIAEWNDGEDGPNTYEWDEGIAP